MAQSFKGEESKASMEEVKVSGQVKGKEQEPTEQEEQVRGHFEEKVCGTSCQGALKIFFVCRIV